MNNAAIGVFFIALTTKSYYAKLINGSLDLLNVAVEKEVKTHDDCRFQRSLAGNVGFERRNHASCKGFGLADEDHFQLRDCGQESPRPNYQSACTGVEGSAYDAGKGGVGIMSNAELRGMTNELARLIVLSRAIPAQLLSKAQRLYHALQMEASELPQKKICAMCARKDEQF